MPASKKADENNGPRYPVDTLWFQNRIKDIDKTQRGLAKHLKRDPSAVSLMLKGERKIQIYEATRIAEFLGVPLAEVLERAGIPQSELLSSDAHHVQVVGTVDAAGTVTLATGKQKKHDFAPRPADAPDDVVAYRFDTAVSAKAYVDAWLVFAVPPDGGIKPNVAGRLCLVRTADKQLLLRFILRAIDSRRYKTLRFLDESPETLEITDASPVSWLKT